MNKYFTEKANLHNHTYYSDGIFSPKSILKYAKKKGIRVISITDHNVIKGALKGYDLAQRYGLIYFPGIECAFSVKGKFYEVLAYFENKNDIKGFYDDFLSEKSFIPEFSSFLEITNLIELYHGVAIAPHPYGRKGVFRDRGKRGSVHFGGNGYEEINAFTGRIRNRRAKRYLDGDNCLVFGAADMHFFKVAMEICYTQLKSRKKITRNMVWENLRGNFKTIEFIPKGKCFPPHMIWFQKVGCALRLDLVRHYFYFLWRKLQHHRRLQADEGEKAA